MPSGAYLDAQKYEQNFVAALYKVKTAWVIVNRDLLF